MGFAQNARCDVCKNEDGRASTLVFIVFESSGFYERNKKMGRSNFGEKGLNNKVNGIRYIYLE